MALLVPATLNGSQVKRVYRKVATDGDAYRFVTSDAGYSELIYNADPARVVISATWRDFTLSFPYLVGTNQLEVHVVSNLTGLAERLFSKAVLDEAKRVNGSWPGALLNPAAVCHFEEIAYNKVRVHRPPSPGKDVFMFSIPHTSLSGALRDRVQVKQQGDRIAVELLGDGDGIMLRSEGGRRGMLRIDDDLNLGVDPA